jgi:tyrosyl-tRNA synthetase
MTDSAGEAARFLTRNAVDALPEGALERQLSEGRPLRVKLGVDPTTPDIHLGHTVVLRKLREFQDLGHTVVLIVGDYTARVGDPSGRSSIRPEVAPEEIDRNAETYQAQAFAVLDRSRTEVRRNGEWLDMAMQDLFRLARTATVAQLLERDDFARRYAAGEPISVLELLYPLMQGYDSVAVRSDVELGGTDQKFNLLLARDVQQAYGVEPQSILTMPILPGIDGVQKMSKSLGNYVGVTDPPEEAFGKLMRVPDATMPIYYELLLDEPFDPKRPPVESKRAMARALTARFHGDEAARAAEERFDRLHVERAAPDDVEDFGFAPAGGDVHVPALISEAFGLSRSEARRLLAQGGVKLDGRTLDGDRLDVPAEELDGALLQVGKRRFKRLRMA